jgi:hypothetical protein
VLVAEEAMSQPLGQGWDLFVLGGRLESSHDCYFLHVFVRNIILITFKPTLIGNGIKIVESTFEKRDIFMEIIISS